MRHATPLSLFACIRFDDELILEPNAFRTYLRIRRSLNSTHVVHTKETATAKSNQKSSAKRFHLMRSPKFVLFMKHERAKSSHPHTSRTAGGMAMAIVARNAPPR
jgi:hypothetical protein